MCQEKTANNARSQYTVTPDVNLEQANQVNAGDPLSLEQILQKQNVFLDNIIQVFQGIILVLDTEAKIAYINPYMEQITGYRQEEVLGKDWFDTFLPPADHDQIRTLFKQAIRNIQTQGNVNPIATKTRQILQIQWYDKTLRDTNGNVMGLVSVGLNVTDHILAEAALRESEKNTDCS